MAKPIFFKVMILSWQYWVSSFASSNWKRKAFNRQSKKIIMKDWYFFLQNIICLLALLSDQIPLHVWKDDYYRFKQPIYRFQHQCLSLPNKLYHTAIHKFTKFLFYYLPCQPYFPFPSSHVLIPYCIKLRHVDLFGSCIGAILVMNNNNLVLVIIMIIWSYKNVLRFRNFARTPAFSSTRITTYSTALFY